MHFGRFLETIYLFFTPGKTDGRVPSQQGAPTTCNLTYWEVSQQTYFETLLASLGVVIGQNSVPQWGWGGGGAPKVEIHPYSRGEGEGKEASDK